MKRNAAIFLTALLVLISIAVFSATAFAVEGEVSVNLPTDYMIGDTVTVPEGTVSFGGEEATASSVIVFRPDGKATSQKTFVAEDYGIYTVRYSAVIGGKKVFAEKQFNVNRNAVTFAKGLSSYYFGENAEYKTAGLNLAIKSGDEAKINRMIDLSKCNFDKSFIDFSFTPANLGTCDAYRVYMKVTDAYDPDNWFIVRMQNWSDLGTWADGFCYIDAKAPDQEWTSSVELADEHNKRGENGKGWYMTCISMTGVESDNATLRKYDTMCIMYDAATNRLVTNSNAYGADCMIDFDEAMWYDLTKEKLWDGFTTGECYVSFYGDRYNSDALNICVSRLMGLDLSVADTDETAPMITVDYADEEEAALPYAIVGEKYPIYAAKAMDTVDGEVRVITSVYRDYYGRKSLCNSTNGCFVPDRTGTYTIVYSATDKCGNTAICCVDVNCVQEKNALTLSVSGQQSKGNAGEKILLVSGLSATGNNGAMHYDIDVTLPGTDKHAKIDVKDPVFYTEQSGSYLVTVSVSDYVLTVEKAFLLTVAENPSPFFVAEPACPPYLILGATYSLDIPQVYQLLDGKHIPLTCDVYVKENGGARQKLTNGTYTATTSGTVEFIYSAENAGKKVERSASAKVIDVGYSDTLAIEKYFCDKDGKITIEKSESDIRLSAAHNGTVDFINKLQASDLTISFKTDTDYANFSQIDFYLSDSADSSICVKVSYRRSASGIDFFINDSEFSRLVAADFNGTGVNKPMLMYNNATSRVYGSSDVNWLIEKDMSGKAFVGFPSRYVNVSIGLSGVTGQSKVILYSINNQVFSEMKRDMTKPQIYANSAIGQKTIGDSVTISAALFSDVLDPTLRYVFYVQAPDGSYVRTIDGVTLDTSASPLRDYTFTVDQFGEYYIYYECYDSKNTKPTYFSFAFDSIDKEAPNVKILSGKTAAKVGDSIAVASLDIKDNLSQTCTVKYAVLAPDGVMKIVNESFKAEKAGVYTVYYYVYDEIGNATIGHYDVTVNK